VLDEPEVAFVPLQPPDAVHDVALVDDQLSVLLLPLLMLVGDAVNSTVSADVALLTVTVALAWVVPPDPVQLSVNVLATVIAPVLALPDVPCVPLQPPDAAQDVALVDDHVSVLALP
jgi:hypothetical protein